MVVLSLVLVALTKQRAKAKLSALEDPPIHHFCDMLAISSSQAPAAFFRPYNTNLPVPLGDSTNTPAQTGRSSFWPTVGASCSEAAAVESMSNTRQDISHFSALRTNISLNECTQVNQELEFIDENDEHTDIVAGD
ncbi:hypothetical protein B0H10DRAFT_1953786 [Mycena sp. CBHHK59/15]|nr:hypothetical protein B0H10DRAFT_1953786 [Mycena sp. CBHHK59/15]